MIKVAIPLAKGFEEIEAVSIIDVLRRADIDVLIARLDDNILAQGAHNINIGTQVHIKDISSDQIDMIVLPGGWGGTLLLAKDKYVQKLLCDMDENKKQIAAICAAPYALKQAGVLKENYTCYPSVEEEIKLNGYKADGDMVVEEQNILTSKGPATAICFALAIVKKLKGEKIYKELKDALLAKDC